MSATPESLVGKRTLRFSPFYNPDLDSEDEAHHVTIAPKPKATRIRRSVDLVNQAVEVSSEQAPTKRSFPFNDDPNEGPTPAKQVPPPEIENKSKFVPRLAFRVGIHREADEDFYIHVSSYDGIHKASSATFEIAKARKGGKPYKISLTFEEFNWLMTAADFSIESESISFPGRNNITVSAHFAKNEWKYFKVTSSGKYQKFICIGFDQISNLTKIGKIICRRVSSISTVIRDYHMAEKYDIFPTHVASSYFHNFINFKLFPDGTGSLAEPQAIQQKLMLNIDWHYGFNMIAPLFGIGPHLDPTLVEEAMKNGEKLCRGKEIGIDGRILSAVDCFFAHIQ